MDHPDRFTIQIDSISIFQINIHSAVVLITIRCMHEYRSIVPIPQFFYCTHMIVVMMGQKNA